ncbi:MAG: glycosyltransferase [Desulfovibrio sp.]|nr:glycosyltransferase [Desulfovibrio sp.]
MAKSVLDALAKGDYCQAVPLACQAAQECGKAAFFEINALCASTLARAGNAEAALEYWDKIIRSAPQKLLYLEAGIGTALQCASGAAAQYLENWLRLFERVYIKTPNARFLTLLSARGWQGEGSVGISEGRVRGWVWSAAKPGIIVESPAKLPLEISLKPVEKAGDRILYKLDSALPETARSYKINIIANGHVQGSPLFVSPARLNLQARRRAGDRLTVIIPVYGDYVATLRCLGSVLGSLSANRLKPRLLVVWDCGPDKRLLMKLRRLADRGKIELLENPHNLGFIGSVNAALAQTGGDVILLNADTLVHGDWIDRLALSASGPETATVTALGNEAELMSFPSFTDRGKISGPGEVKALDQAASRLDWKEALVELPVGVGFCMYVTARAINAIGGLDGRFLFRGYGEEVDYCLRASEAGLKNFGAFNVFVGHLGEKSFGIGKKALAAQNNDAIFGKFPGYRRDYEVFLAGSRPRRLREKISRNILEQAEFRGILELRPWSGRYLPPWIQDAKCKPAGKGGALFLQPGRNPRALLRAWQDLPVAELRFDLRDELQELAALLNRMGIRQAVSRLGTRPLLELAQKLGLELLAAAQGPVLPVLTGSLPAAMLAASRGSMAEWRLLICLARENPASLIYVFQLGTSWGNAPRPANLRSLPLLESYQPLGLKQCLLWDAADLEGWQRWLAAHDCPDITFSRPGCDV